MENRQDQFAYYVQLFGGITASSRRLGVDERALRRFINGERPISDSLLADTAEELRKLTSQAGQAIEQISITLAASRGEA